MVTGETFVPQGSRVQVEKDDGTPIEGPDSEADPEKRDHPSGSRTVMVLVLDGEKKGESTIVPRWNLRPLRPLTAP